MLGYFFDSPFNFYSKTDDKEPNNFSNLMVSLHFTHHIFEDLTASHSARPLFFGVYGFTEGLAFCDRALILGIINLLAEDLQNILF